MPLEFRKQRSGGSCEVRFGAPLDSANPQAVFRRFLVPLTWLWLSASVLAAPVPVAGDAPVPVDRLRLGNTNVLPMTGTWRFKLDHGISPGVRGEFPGLWSAEKPNLYYVFHRLADGNQTVVERVQDRIGFRKVELKNGVFEVNGVPVKFTGGRRHEEFSPYGHALTEECWKTDIALMKADNVNAIRTAHYNHAARFMELCDEAGFYVLDEIPSCWVANEIKDASRPRACVFHAKETLAGGKVLACGESHIAAKPRSSVDAAFPAPAGMDSLRLEFIHPGGRSVFATNLRVKN